MADIKRRRKSVSLKIEHLRLELEEREDVIKGFEQEFLKELAALEVEELEPEKPAQPLVGHVNVVDRTEMPEEVESNQPDTSDRPEDAK